MYNRYIPQADGSFQRSRVPEPEMPQKPAAERADPAEPEKTQAKSPPEIRQNPPPQGRSRPPVMLQGPRKQYRPPKQEQNHGSIGSFFKGLLPENLDAEDLIVILLLLLMSGSNSKDPNAALLTLGIYLFM